MDALARFLVSHQHLIFYPLMAFGRINLCARRAHAHRRVAEPSP